MLKTHFMQANNIITRRLSAYNVMQSVTTTEEAKTLKVYTK